jgi:hypothetical protein
VLDQREESLLNQIRGIRFGPGKTNSKLSFCVSLSNAFRVQAIILLWQANNVNDLRHLDPVGQILLNACCPFLLRHYSAKTASVFIN